LGGGRQQGGGEQESSEHPAATPPCRRFSATYSRHPNPHSSCNIPAPRIAGLHVLTRSSQNSAPAGGAALFSRRCAADGALAGSPLSCTAHHHQQHTSGTDSWEQGAHQLCSRFLAVTATNIESTRTALINHLYSNVRLCFLEATEHRKKPRWQQARNTLTGARLTRTNSIHLLVQVEDMGWGSRLLDAFSCQLSRSNFEVSFCRRCCVCLQPPCTVRMAGYGTTVTCRGGFGWSQAWSMAHQIALKI
jgi:hypothetical protein